MSIKEIGLLMKKNKTNSYLDRFEKEKLCLLLECDVSEIDSIIQNTDKIFKDSDSIYDLALKILQQGNNIREATLIGILCGKHLGFNQAQEQIEEDIKQKLLDAFNNNRGGNK